MAFMFVVMGSEGDIFSRRQSTSLTCIPWTAWSCKNYEQALEITGENLEDLLAYDDLFLDYFNAFLSLPVFPQPMRYNRLTGDFEDASKHLHRDSSSVSSSSSEGNNLPYGTTDSERDKLLEWAREERLPLFLSTQLFREFKLCKLLLRPLDDRYSASRNSSNQLRGYSRQSESYVSSLSNSADNSGHDEIDEEEMAAMQSQFQNSTLFKYQRPGSRAVSMPTRLDFEAEFYVQGSTATPGTQEPPPSETMPKSASFKKKIREISDNDKEEDIPERKPSVVKFDPVTSDVKNKRSAQKERRQKSEAEEAFMRHARVLSAPLNYADYMRHPMFGDFDFLFGEDEPDPDGRVYVSFQDERVSEEQTETDVKNMEGRLKMSLQQLKEQVLGKQNSMEGFKEFLSDTAGIHLLNFWLDCEYFKDAMENFDEIVNMDIRNRLFRDIQDKYKLNLTEEARDQITKASCNSSLSHTVFIRTQYDVLRRLRAYWVPRYLIHMERLRELRAIGSVMGIKGIRVDNSSRKITPFLPSISLVNSMPVRPDDVLTYSKTKSWDFLSKGGRKLDSRISSAKLKPALHPPSPVKLTKDRFLVALTSDKVAGGPFQRFLEKQEDRRLVSCLLFWQDVTDYGKEEDRSADRLLRLCHAWNIYNLYFPDGSNYPIGATDLEKALLHHTLLNAKDFVEANIFTSAKARAVELLEENWITYLKEDLKTFLDAHVRNGAQSPPESTDVIDIVVTNDELIITRPDPWVKRRDEVPIVLEAERLTSSGWCTHNSSRKQNHIIPTTDSERDARLRAALRSADLLGPEERAERRAKARAKRKEMERERKKAIRAAYRRVKEAKRKKEPEKEDEEDMEFDIDGEKKPSKPPPPFVEMLHNKQIMTNFKKSLAESDEKERANMVYLYFDIENYLNLGNSKSEVKKKDSLAQNLYKSYIDAQGKKKVNFSEKLNSKMSERPKSPVIKDMQHYILPKIEESFKSYIIEKANEHGMEPREFANLSQAELSLRMGTDASLMGGTWKKGRKGKGPEKPTGRAQPNKEDKDEFFKSLKQSAGGHLTLPMLFFYKYLLKHGEEDGSPLIDKDLFFYIEVQKFKDANHAHSDEELLRKKVQSIMECFLDSVTSPTLQIDITPQLQEKSIKAAQRYLAGKDVVANLFDEAQLAVFKELLPYWAGFRRGFQPPEDPAKRPVTKYQKMLKKRLDNIENYEIPKEDFTFPSIPDGSIAAYTFSLSDGVRWRREGVRDWEVSSDEAGSILGSPMDRSETATTRGGTSQKTLDQLKKRRKSHSLLSVPPGGVMTRNNTESSTSISVKE
ncbi:regulator of G-protein signaling 22-like isoform X12 [Crassostrea angulata]|uniref:regulator of G-protein signaling 22-like isoform X12 n=1 Tax=Magallana angulata TaxID=2784310 RepID=UPI0022B14036|nr:regulator of G-protein signaling 22-like isoform X12 [Crassostrea angulata]